METEAAGFSGLPFEEACRDMFPGNYISQKTSFLPPNQELRLTGSVASSFLSSNEQVMDEASWSKWPTAGILSRRATRGKAGPVPAVPHPFHTHFTHLELCAESGGKHCKVTV